PLNIPDWPWQSIAMDFVTCLPAMLRKHSAVLTVVDSLTKMHPVVNVEHLKQYHWSQCFLTETYHPPPEQVGDHVEWVVDKVCAKCNGEHGKEYLVKWLGFNEDEDSWELESSLKNAPSLLAKFKKQSAHKKVTYTKTS
ncbi:hypothetical protein LPJ61_006058, partial [Coemansia biformis]